MDKKTNNHPHDGHKHNNTAQQHCSSRKPIHHNWLFWVGVVLMLLAILYYIMSDDFTIVPNLNK